MRAGSGNPAGRVNPDALDMLRQNDIPTEGYRRGTIRVTPGVANGVSLAIATMPSQVSQRLRRRLSKSIMAFRICAVFVQFVSNEKRYQTPVLMKYPG